MSNNPFVSKIPHWKLKLFWNNILKISIITLPIFCCLKNTYLWEISTLLKIMPWYQRRKQGRNWGVGCYLGCRIKGCKRVLRSNTGWVHSVSSSAILCCCFCSAAVRQFSSITVRKSWDTRSSCMVWELLWSKQATMLHCGFHYKQGCRIPLSATLNTLTSSSPPTSVSHLQILQFSSGPRSGK